jgi:hypothetical protein
MLVWVVRPHRCSRAHCTGENFFRMRNSPKFARVLTIKRGVTLHQGLVRARSPLVEGGQARTRHSTSHHVCQLRTLQLGPPTATLTNDALQRVGRGPSSLSHERNSRTRPPHLIACPAFACTPPLYAHHRTCLCLFPTAPTLQQARASTAAAAAVEGRGGRPRAVGGQWKASSRWRERRSTDHDGAPTA